MINLTTFEIIGLLVLAFLPIIVMSMMSREELMQFFFPDANWYMEATSNSHQLSRSQESGMLYLVPFKADRLPKTMREESEEKKTYADLLDVIKANGGMTNWINTEVTNQLNTIGCSYLLPSEHGAPTGQFILSGEVMTTVRSHDMSQIAFKVKLTCGRRTIFSKLYSATCRESKTTNMTQALGLDAFIRPPFAGMSNRKTNRLLTQAMTDIMQQLSDDLSRILPYLGENKQVQYAG